LELAAEQSREASEEIRKSFCTQHKEIRKQTEKLRHLETHHLGATVREELQRNREKLQEEMEQLREEMSDSLDI
jgi:F0F1-type ATP synthase membrane subunit b/b'